MLSLRRVFVDGSDRPELVLLHCTVHGTGPAADLRARCSLVMTQTAEPGRREAFVFLPDPPGGEGLHVRYFFSTVWNGAEWFSPVYEVAVPGGVDPGDLVPVPESAGGNLRPAEGRGTFRVLLPLREGRPGAGAVRYGFGAMRKKPSADLCRAAIPLDRLPPVAEVPEALSVLKNRPMPYFLYHVREEGGELAADKINCARLALRDEAGDILCARLLWGDPSWKAQNLSMMEVRNFASRMAGAGDYFFSADRDGFLRDRAEALGGTPAPRAFEAFVYGPERSRVEYCFQVLRRRSDGSVSAEWRNREGGNWTVTL